jgi:type I restriction enzyme S subunit
VSAVRWGMPAPSHWPRYLARLIEGHQHQLLNVWSKEGTTVESLESDLVADTEIAVPPLLQQRAIADYLDSGIPWLGEIPAHWKIIQLKFVARSLQTGPFGSQLHAEEYITGGIPVVNPSHLNSGRICADDRVSVDEATAERLVIHRLSPGDVVFARRGELGRCGVVEPSQAGWLCGTGSLRTRLRLDMVDPYCLVLVFTETQVSDVLTFESVGSTMDNLNTEILGSCQFGVPPLTEQRGIVAHVSADTARLDALRAATERTIALLKERRAALIAAAVTGKLDVQGAWRHIAVVAD